MLTLIVGWNDYGQLGLGDTHNRGDDPGEMGSSLSIVDLGVDFVVDDFSCGAWHVCASSTTEYVKCFGYGSYGQLGYESTDNIGDQAGEMSIDLPVVDLGANFNVSELGSGPVAVHSCAISTTNGVKCWGNNWYYQLGLGDKDNKGNTVGDMGDSLPYVNITMPSPTQSPTYSPSQSPSPSPSSAPSQSPSSSEPTSNPTTKIRFP